MGSVYPEYPGSGGKTIGGVTHPIIVKIDTSGNFLWEKEYMISYNYSGSGFIYAKNGKLYITGIYINNDPVADVYLIETDSAGNENWQKSFGDFIKNDAVFGLDTTIDNGLILSTTQNVSGGNYKVNVFKLDSAGNTQWTRQLGYNNYWHSLGCKQLQDGNFFFYGNHEDQTNIIQDSWFVKLDASGNVLVDTTYKFSQYKDAASFAQIRNNSIWIFGIALDTLGVLKAYIASLDFNLNLNWFRIYGERNSTNLLIQLIENGATYNTIWGMVLQDDTLNTMDEWYMVVDNFGCDTLNCSVGIHDLDFNENEISIYPNPGNGMINIISSENVIAIEVHDLTGKIVLTIQSPNGINQFQTENLQNGIYLLILKTESGQFSRKLIIQK